MSERDPVEFLESRIKAHQQRKEEEGSAWDRLEQRKAAFSQEAQGIKERKAQETAAYKESLLGRTASAVDKYSGGILKLSPETSGGRVINLAAGGAAALEQGMENAITMPDRMIAAGNSDGLTSEQKEAYERARADRQAREELANLQAREQGRSELKRQLLDPMVASPNAGETQPLSDEEQARMASLENRESSAREGDEAILNQRPEMQSSNLPANHPAAQADKIDRENGKEDPTAGTRLETIENAEKRIESLSDLTPDLDPLFYSAEKGYLEADAAQTWRDNEEEFLTAMDQLGDEDKKEGLVNLASSVGTMISEMGGKGIRNIDGVMQFMAREVGEDVGLAAIPGAGPALMHSANTSRALESFNKGVQNYYEEHGEYPPEDVRNHMADNTALMLVADYAGDAGMIKGAKFAKRGQAKLRDALSAAPRVGAAGTAESVTEGVQTYAQGEAENKPATNEEIFVGSALGGVGGSSVAAPSAVNNVYEGTRFGLGATAEKAVKAAESPTSKAQREATEAADKTGDVSVLLDPENPAYAPDKAVEVLSRQAEQEDITPERKEELAVQADKAVGNLEEEVARLEEEYTSTEAGAEDTLPAIIKNNESKLAKLTEGTPEHAQLKEKIGRHKDYLGKLQGDNKKLKARRSKARTAYQKAERSLRAASAAQAKLRETTEETVDVEAEVAKANATPDTDGAAEAADRVVKLAISNVDRVTPEQATELADNTANSLNDGQRSFLRSYSEAQQARNELLSMDNVTTDVMDGNKKRRFIGVNQYKERFNTQIRNNNGARAQAQVTGIKSFADQREQKAAVLQEGLNEIEASNGKTKRVDYEYNKAEGKYQRKNGTFRSAKERDQNGGLIVTQRQSGRLLDQVSAEAKAVRAAANEMEAAYNVFNDTGEASDVSTSASLDEDTTPSTAETTTSEASATAPDADIATTQQNNNETEVTATEEAANDADEGTPETSAPAATQASNTDNAPESTSAANDAVGEPDAEPVPESSPEQTEAAPETGQLERGKSRNSNAGALRQVIKGARENARQFQEWDKSENGTVAQEQALQEDLDDIKGTLDTALTNLSNNPNEAIAGKAQELQKALTDNFAEMRPQEVTDSATEMGQFLKDVDESTEDLFNQESQVSEPTAPEAGNDPTAPARANEVTEDPDAEPEVDEAAGEVIDGKPTQNNDPDTNGEGQLSLFDDVGDRSQGQIDPTRFKEANLVKEYLRQDQRDVSRRVTKRPLVEVRNFLSQLAQNKKLAQNFLSEKLTPIQEALVEDLSTRLAVFNESVQKSLVPWNNRSSEFRYQDYIGYFRDDVTGEMDENVLTAISAGMYSWLADNAALRHHSAKGVNSLLARDSKAKVLPVEYENYGGGWYRQNHIQNDMGKRIAESLGLTKDNGVPVDLLEKVQGALGGRALAALVEQGIVETKTVTEGEAAAISNRDVKEGVEKHEFVRVVADDTSYGRTIADDIVESVQGSQSLLPKMFGVEDRKAPPTFKPVPFKDRKPKRSQMLVSKLQEKILNDYNKVAYYIEEDTWAAWSSLDEETQVIVAGGKDMNEPIHVANYMGHEGGNDALKREASDFAEFVNTVDEKPNQRKTPFFFDWVVWKMGRMGIKGSMVNPQTSKIHRALVGQAAWTETATIDNGDGSFDDFLLSVADGLGVATDSDLNENTLEAVRDKMAKPVIENGVIAIIKSRNNEPLDDSDKAAIKTAVKEGGEDMHSFQTLVALGKYLEASENNETSFSYTLGSEIDGKTNGPMLTQWLLGAAHTANDLLDVVVSGGFFTAADGVKHIGEWARHRQNLDLYQRVAKELNGNRAASLVKEPKKVAMYEAIDFFIGEQETEDGNVTKHARKMVKDAVNPLNFGSGTRNIVNGMANVFLDGVYQKIEDLAKMERGPEQAAAKQELITHLNHFFSSQNKLPMNMSVDALMKYEIKGPAKNTLVSRYQNGFGKDIKKTLETMFEPLIDRREKVNKAATLAFTLYNAAYRYERQQYIRELMESGMVAFEKRTTRDKRKSMKALLQDLTPDQEAEVRERVKALRPLVNTAFSKQEGDLEAGLMLAKQESMTDGTFTYTNTTKMAKGYGVRNLRSQGGRVQQTDPGLGTVIWQVHSTDAFIAATSFIEQSALNVHDALIVPPSEKSATARKLNQQTFEAILSYSPAREVSDALMTTVSAFVDYARENDAVKNPQVMKAIQEGLDSVAPYGESGTPDTLFNALRDARNAGKNARWVTLRALYKVSSISQYTAEGGHYELTENDRDRISEAMKELQTDRMPERFKSELSELLVMLGGEPLKTKQGQEAEVEQQDPSTAVSTEPATDTGTDPDAPYDSASDPVNRDFVDDAVTEDVDREMLRMLEATEVDTSISTEEDVVNNSTLQQLLKVARKGAPASFGPLLDRIEAKLPADFPTFTVSNLEGAGGQFAGDPFLKTGQVSINVGYVRRAVKSRLEGNENSSLFSTAEIVTHELIHAVTALAIETADPNSAMMRRFKGIQTDIKNWKANNASQFSQLDEATQQALDIMVDDVKEVPTYGMSSKRVQLALRGIQSSQGKGSAWSGFVNTVRNLLGLSNKEMSVLDDVLVATDEAVDADIQGGFKPFEIQRNNIALSIAEAGKSTSPTHYTSQQIFDALGAADPNTDFTQTAELQKLLTNIANKLHGPSGAFKERAREAEAISAEDVFLKALSTGKAPFASETRVAGFKLNDQQAFVLEQVEATLRASMDVAGTNDLARRELSKVWKEAKQNLGPETFYDGDWAQATKTEKDRAQAKHDFLFKMTADNGNAKDHLARFAALAMVDPTLKARMDFPSALAEEKASNRTLTQILIDAFKKILSVFHNRLTKTYAGQQADKKVWALMDQLVDIEGKRRARLKDTSVTWQDNIEDKMDKGRNTIRTKASDIVHSDYVRNRANNFVGAGATLVSVVASERGDEVMNNMAQVRQQMFEAKQGFVASMITEVRGAHNKGLLKAHSLLRKVSKKNEQERLKLSDTYRQAVLESFENNGKDLTKEEKAAITRILLDTDMATLMDDFSQDEMVELLSNPSRLKRAIAEQESVVGNLSGNWKDYYLGAAEDLAVHMATGDNQSQHLMLNAHNIANLHGTKHRGKVSQTDADAVSPELDKLISLYALDASDTAHKKNLLSVMRREAPRGNQSGPQMVLELHKKMQQDALDVEFDGNPAQMQKGYRAEIYHSQKSVMTAPVRDKADYEAMGYQMEGELPLDPNDPNRERQALYVIMDGGPTRRLSGTISTTNAAIRGTAMKATPSTNRTLLAERDSYIEDLIANGKKANRGNFKSYLAPVMTSNGNVSSYRYLMKQSTKDGVLDRNNAVEDVFGAMASQAFDKTSSREQNRLIIESLKGQYDEEYAKNPKGFVRIAADSSDPQLAQAYKLLPDDAKKAVKEMWGKKEMMVRGDMLDLHFGYRKYSLADGIQKNPEDRKHVEKLHAWMFEKFFGKKAFLRARQTGNAWTELVTEIKDILVIKTGLTLIGNVSSNMSLLVWHGVPLRELASNHRVAIEGVLNYKRDYTELQKLQINLDTNRITDRDAAEQRVLELQDNMKKNPVAVMIEEGLMPTIVEDVDLHEDPYSYKSQLAEKTEKWTGKVWKPLRTVGRYTYMTKDTPLYKAFSQGTQISDFVARYTLYQHLTTRKRNKMEHEAAIQRSSDMFVNYDVPSHKVMQYLNDIGLLRFTKYYIRIQKPILTLFAEHPVRGILMVLLNTMMPGLSLLNDSQISGQVGNPMQGGAFDYPGVLDELATVKAAMSLGE